MAIVHKDGVLKITMPAAKPALPQEIEVSQAFVGS